MFTELQFGAIRRFRQKLKKSPGLVPFLSSGDSWFAFPTLLRTNIIDALSELNEGRAAWLRLESNGHEMRELLAGKEYQHLRLALSDPSLKFAGILFSGGGNDLIGPSLVSLINPYEAGMTWMNCINLVRFERRLQEIENAYQDLLDLRDDYQPQAYLFTHAYDFPIPGDKPIHIGPIRVGPWMQPYLASRGIKNLSHQREIMTFMLKRLDELMQKLEGQHERVVHIRTQSTLTDAEWDDELHPTTHGFRKIAERFQVALVKKFPTLEPGAPGAAAVGKSGPVGGAFQAKPVPS
jgi:hypothetical protein